MRVGAPALAGVVNDAGSVPQGCEELHSAARDKSICIDFASELGRGAFGVVRRGVFGDAEIVAVKSLSSVEAGRYEVDVMRRLSHRNLCALHASFETSGGVHLVLEYCAGGDLHSMWVLRPCFDDESVGAVMTQLFSAVAYLHHERVVHRDIKLANVLLAAPVAPGSSLQLRLADLGLACVLGECERRSDVAGTPGYTAPEMLEGCYSTGVDVWSCGALLYELLRGESLLPEKCLSDERRELAFLKSREFCDRVSIPRPSLTKGTPHAEYLLRKLLQRCVEARFTAHEAMSKCEEFWVSLPVCRRWSGAMECSVASAPASSDVAGVSVSATRGRRWARRFCNVSEEIAVEELLAQVLSVRRL